MVVARTFILAAISTSSVFAESFALRTCNSIRSAISHSSVLCGANTVHDAMVAFSANSCASTISNISSISWPGSLEYKTASTHWSILSSGQPECTVEPASPEDLAVILKIIAADRTPFGVKSGGHTSNPGFSSTNGVQISLSRFSEVAYDKATSTVRIGTGSLWDQVYTALEPHGVIVVGGRVSGPGVGGVVTGGGGYAWNSNQYGLTVDTIISYDLILPNGTFLVVTDASHPDLFWALKGGYNNFGVVTTISLKAFPQDQVWGGYIIYTEDHLKAVTQAVARFSANNTDPKASILLSYTSLPGSGLNVILILFYDAPTIANGVFYEFLAIESIIQDVSTRSYSSLVKSIPPSVTNTRFVFHTVSVLEFSQNVLDTIANETLFWDKKLQSSSLSMLSYGVEPFHGASTFATPAAYPHNAPLSLLIIQFSWTDPTTDDIFTHAIKESAERIYEVALAEGQDVGIENGKQIRYPNYAMWDTPLEQMYGENVNELKKMRRHYDPNNLMSLAGGFRF